MPDVMTFTKRPVSVEAIQWTGENLDEVWVAFGAADIYGPTPERNPDQLIISTSEGDMRANVGDWIIKGVKDELYPCKPDVFRATYRPDGGEWCTVCGKATLDADLCFPEEAEDDWVCMTCAKAPAE